MKKWSVSDCQGHGVATNPLQTLRASLVLWFQVPPTRDWLGVDPVACCRRMSRPPCARTDGPTCRKVWPFLICNGRIWQLIRSADISARRSPSLVWPMLMCQLVFKSLAGAMIPSGQRIRHQISNQLAATASICFVLPADFLQAD